jgi:hypothetical protein
MQNEVSVLSPRVAFLDQQRTILTVGNSHLKQRIAALAQDKIFKDGECNASITYLGCARQLYKLTTGMLVHTVIHRELIMHATEGEAFRGYRIMIQRMSHS